MDRRRARAVVQCGLPVITVANAWTMPQERYNTQWVREMGIGVVLKSFRGVRTAVDDVITHLPQLRPACGVSATERCSKCPKSWPACSTPRPLLRARISGASRPSRVLAELRR